MYQSPGSQRFASRSSPSVLFNWLKLPRLGAPRQFQLLSLLHLREVQFDGRRAPEDLHGDLQPVFLVVHVLYDAIEIVERSIDHADHLAGLEEHLGPRLVHAFLNATQNLHRFLVRDGSGLLRRATDEAEHLRHIAHQVPGVLIHLHLHEHIARVELALALALHAIPHLDHFFGRNEDFAKLRLQSRAANPLFEGLLHAVLEVRVGMDHVPSQRHDQPPCPVSARVAQASARSRPQKKMPATSRKTNTTRVVIPVSCRFGHTILRSSTRESAMNCFRAVPYLEKAITAAASTMPAATASQRSHAAWVPRT